MLYVLSLSLNEVSEGWGGGVGGNGVLQLLILLTGGVPKGPKYAGVIFEKSFISN